jgi:hypothetical protein
MNSLLSQQVLKDPHITLSKSLGSLWNPSLDHLNYPTSPFDFSLVVDMLYNTKHRLDSRFDPVFIPLFYIEHTNSPIHILSFAGRTN